MSFLLFTASVHAADRHWVGAVNSSDRWENTNNWSTLPKGAGGASVPGTSDVAIFSASGNTVRIRSAVSVAGIFTTPAWTGSVLQGSGTVFVGSSGVRIGSGRLVGGTGTFGIAGGFTMTGGIVSAMQSTFTLSGSFSLTNGNGAGIPAPSFTSTGTLVFDGVADQNFTKGANTALALTNLMLENSGGGTSDGIVVSANGGLNLSGALTITSGNLDLELGDIPAVVEGGITIANNAQASLTTGAGNVTMSGNLVMGASGVLNPTTANTIILNGITQQFDTNGTSLQNLTIASSSQTTLTSDQNILTVLQVNTGSTLALGSYTLSATGASIVNYGTINEGTGKISHTATNMIISESTYTSAQASFPIGSTVYFSLTEQDENISGTAQDTVSVTVTLGNGDSETVTLQETNNTSAIFGGSITTAQVSPTASNGTLEADNSQIITATFTDAQDALVSSDMADLTVGSSPVTGTGSHGAGGKAARLALMRARQSAALKSSAPESDEPVVKVDYGVTKVQPRSVQRETSTPSEREVRLQNRLQQYGVPQSTSSLKPAAVREQVTENFKIRTCGRVMRWFQGNGKMLGRVNARLEGRFGFTCSE